MTYPLAPRGEQADVLHGFTVPDPYRRHGLSEITVHDLGNGDRLAALDLPGMGSVGRLSERPEGGHEAWFAYTDHTSRTGRHPEEDTMHSDIAYQLLTSVTPSSSPRSRTRGWSTRPSRPAPVSPADAESFAVGDGFWGRTEPCPRNERAGRPERVAG